MKRSLAALLLGPALLAACSSQAETTLPASVSLKGVGHDNQGLNNCGPVTASIVLGYYGKAVTQAQAAAALKDSSKDVEVSTQEVAAYLERNGLKTLIRYAGTPVQMRALLAAKLPVVVQQRLQRGDKTAHFRTLYAYGPDSFTASDSLLGPELTLTEARFTELWDYYNGEYLLAYPANREAEVRAILGKDWDEAANWSRLRDEMTARTRQDSATAFDWWGLGQARLALGQPEEAAKAFDRAVEIGVPLQYHWYRQGAMVAWNRTGQTEKTREVAQRILDEQPGIKEVEALLGAAGTD
ncbi:C39 family peptidase [Deinococcus sp. HMF7604]|uniref:C39 family peptidase n=1 Tax=Deinococcus betulae TaxID=2873312 RepID=UPI001CCBCC98|nr:C39 family peptidase [Deinococcus betulae]MBZ9751615.1 C39 family peptidase [Deinococcus betulae]